MTALTFSCIFYLINVWYFKLFKRIGQIIPLRWLGSCSDNWLHSVYVCLDLHSSGLLPIQYRQVHAFWRTTTHSGILSVYLNYQFWNKCFFSWENLLQRPIIPRVFMAMLCFLLVLHLFWTYLLVKIAVKSVKSGVDDIREDSESDEEECPTTSDHKKLEWRVGLKRDMHFWHFITTLPNLHFSDRI